MQLEPVITYRGVSPTPTIENKVRQRLRRLERHHPRVMACRVMVEAPHRHQAKGVLYCVRLDVTVPGHELVVNRDPKAHQAHEEVLTAVRDAFDAMERQLDGLRGRKRREIRTEPLTVHGQVVELHPEHGRIAGLDGNLAYFHRNSVVGDAFDKLSVGTDVNYVVEYGEKGPQAASVTLSVMQHATV